MAAGGLDIPGLTDFREIGSGGFASVYSAYEPDAGRTVAVKVLRAVDERGRRRFDRERRMIGMTTAHPNIVTLFRSGFTEQGNLPYLVMEHVPGGSLEDRLVGGARIPIQQAVGVIAPVADALGFAHRAGIVHKDVKPANILLTGTGTAKLTDFGVSAVRDATGTSQIGFSFAYSPPETFHASVDVEGRTVDLRDERSDLYSLAATLSAMITGTDSFAAETQAMAMHRILTEAPRSVGHPGLDEFFTTALAKDPNERFPDADRFLRAMHAAVDGTAVYSPAPPGVRALVDSPPEHQRPSGAAIIGAGVDGGHLPDPGPTRPVPPPGSGGSHRPVLLDGAPPPKTRPATALPSTGARSTDRRERRSWPMVAAAVLAVGLIAGGAGFLVLTRNTDGGGSPEAETAVAADTVPADADDAAASTRDAAAADTEAEAADGGIDGETDQAAAEDIDTATDGDIPDAAETGDEETGAAADQADSETADGTNTADGTSDGAAAPDTNRPTLVDEVAGASVATPGVETNFVIELGDGLLASYHFSGGARIWRRGDPGNPVGTITDGVGIMTGLDNGLIATSGTFGDGTVQIRDPRSPEITIATYEGLVSNAAVTALTQLDNGLIVAGGAAGGVHLFDPDNPSGPVAAYAGHASVIITDIVQLPSGLVLSNGEGDGAHLWNPADPQDPIRVYQVPGPGTLATYTNDLVVLDDGRIVSNTLDGNAHVWDPNLPNSPQATFTGHEVNNVIGLDGGLVATGGEDGVVHIWDPAEPGTILLSYGAHTGPVYGLVVLSDGLIASVGADEVHIWSPWADR